MKTYYKKNQLLILVFLGILVLFAAILFYFMLDNKDSSSNAGGLTTDVSKGDDVPLDTLSNDLPQLDILAQNPTPSSVTSNAQILSPQMQGFVENIEAILKGSQGHESKILSLIITNHNYY